MATSVSAGSVLPARSAGYLVAAGDGGRVVPRRQVVPVAGPLVRHQGGPVVPGRAGEIVQQLPHQADRGQGVAFHLVQTQLPGRRHAGRQLRTGLGQVAPVLQRNAQVHPCFRSPGLVTGPVTHRERVLLRLDRRVKVAQLDLDRSQAPEHSGQVLLITWRSGQHLHRAMQRLPRLPAAPTSVQGMRQVVQDEPVGHWVLLLVGVRRGLLVQLDRRLHIPRGKPLLRQLNQPLHRSLPTLDP
jgi:hypothetical protein